MVPMISVIMPVYNTGNVLIQTVKSVLDQTYRDFELLLIDDGSTDESGVLCDTFAKQDPRIVVIHQPNGGICAARNTGLCVAKGSYITFCDHDDLYLPELLQTEIEAAEKYDADMVVVGKRVESSKGVEESTPSFCFAGKEIQDNLLEILDSGALGCVWNVLFKKSTLQGIKFKEEYKRGHEDFTFNMSVLLNVGVICAVPKVEYIHIIRENLSTSAKIYREAVPAMIDASNKIFELIQLCNVDIKNKEREIVKVHGGGIRCCLAYSVKAGMTYAEFCMIADQLQIISQLKINRIDYRNWKNAVVYKLLLKRKYGMLYNILQLNMKQ